MNPALEYIHRQQQPFRDILLQLQQVVAITIPDAVLLYKWGLPFYYLEGTYMFCFFNVRKTFVDLGMSAGYLIDDGTFPLIAGEGRKQLRSLRFYSSEEIDFIMLQDLLMELERAMRAQKND